MSVAYSKLPIVNATVRGDTQANFRSDLDGILTRAGWTTKTAVTNGIKYTITSPDGFAAKVLVQDAGSFVPGGLSSTGSVVIQFMNVAETVTGFPHELLAPL